MSDIEALRQRVQPVMEAAIAAIVAGEEHGYWSDSTHDLVPHQEAHAKITKRQRSVERAAMLAVAEAQRDALQKACVATSPGKIHALRVEAEALVAELKEAAKGRQEEA